MALDRAKGELGSAIFAANFGATGANLDQLGKKVLTSVMGHAIIYESRGQLL
jgi:hypothetical protein